MSEVGTDPQVTMVLAATEPAGTGTRSHAGGLSLLQSVATTIGIAVFVSTFVVQAFQIPSESMEKTLLIGDYLLVDKVHYASPGLWGWLLPYRQIHHQD